MLESLKVMERAAIKAAQERLEVMKLFEERQWEQPDGFVNEVAAMEKAISQLAEGGSTQTIEATKFHSLGNIANYLTEIQKGIRKRKSNLNTSNKIKYTKYF